MSSLDAARFYSCDLASHSQFTPQHSNHHLSTLQPSLPIDSDAFVDNDALIAHLNAILHPQNRHCMSDSVHPRIRVESSTPAPLPLTCDERQDSVIAWQMYQSGMGGPTVAQRPLKRARTDHQRTPSASTVASTSPASPYATSTSYPQIANTEFDPNSPGQAQYADQAGLFSKNLPTPQQTPTDAAFMSGAYIPSQFAHTPNAHLAMKGFAIDHHQLADEIPPEFYTSSRHSMSSHGGNNSPATPQSGVGDNYEPRNFVNQNGEATCPQYDTEVDCLLFDALDLRHANAHMQLFQRTDSQAFQDELYNPQTSYISSPLSASKRNSDFLTPHRNLINERLQTANLARTGSPTSAISRERSPFRDGSPLAPTNDWSGVGTAATMRQQQKEEAEQAEYAQHRPSLQREPTKTISPKDAVLDYAETDQQPLFQESFQDSIPTGYRQHTGATDAWQHNYVSAAPQSSASFGNLVATGGPHNMTPFRSADDFSGTNFNFMQLPHGHPNQVSEIQGPSFPASSYVAPKMEYPETNPEFPTHLTRMESSVSETGGLPLSSQDSFNVTSTPQRPADTRANAGVYTCTYHGCTYRFDTPTALQKHKRDYHRSQQHRDSASGTNTDTTTSPRSTESPAPSTNGMTPAAILARNSQAGPHKCTRINPSTNKPCNTIFSRPYDLTRHEDTIHNNRKQKVRCPMCREEKTFSRNDALTRHMRVVHPDVEAYGKRGRRTE
jgi:hypothetical protein